MTKNKLIIVYLLLSIVNLVMFIVWLFRPDPDYVDKHRYCAVLSFQLFAVNLIEVIMLAV